MLATGKALAALRPHVVYPGHRDCPTARGDHDEVSLPVVGARGWCVLMRDKRIRYRRPERDKLTAHGVRAFVLTGSGNSTPWRCFACSCSTGTDSKSWR
jgi:PIN like domain